MAEPTEATKSAASALEYEARRRAHVRLGCQGGFDDGWSSGVEWVRNVERQSMLERIVEYGTDAEQAEDDHESALLRAENAEQRVRELETRIGAMRG